MKTFTKFIFFVTLFVVIPGVLLAAETGTLKGVVVDSQTGDKLPGANIVIKQPFIGCSTNIDGQFVLNNVPAGASIITVSYLGYEEQEIKIEIAAGETKTIEIKLVVLSIMGDEVTITAQAQGQRAAINQQLASLTVSNVISSEKMEKLPDANAAEAIGRLPGVSLKRNNGEADKIVIRGLSPKYNNVTIEGVKMASTSDYDRSVDLSMVQSEMLSGVEISKSLRADMDADALGGTVNLKLAKAPDLRKIDFIVEGGYANLSNDFANYKATGGFSDRFFDKKLGVTLKASYEQKQMPSQRFNGGYSGAYWNFVSKDNVIIDSTLDVRTNSATLIDLEQERKRTNGSLIIDYHNDWWEISFFNLFSQKNDDVVSRDNQYSFTGSQENFFLNVSSAEWRTKTRTHTLQNTFRFGSSKIDLNLSTTYADAKADYQNFPFVEINTYGLDQNWLVYRLPQDAIQKVGGPDSLQIKDSYLRSLNLGNQSLIDESYDAKLDYELSFSLFDNVSGKLKLGGKFHQLTRTSDGTAESAGFEWGGGVSKRQAFIAMYPWITTDINSQRGISAHNFVDEGYNPGEFLNGRYELGWTADIDLLKDLQNGFYGGPDDTKYTFSGVDSYQRDYEATEKLSAGYLMAELNIGKNLMLLPGLRYEKNNTEYSAYQIKTNSGQSGIEQNPKYVTTNRTNEQWFPSLNAKYKATDFFTLQGAVYKSTSRPSFREISPLVIYPTEGSYIQSNNPYLEPSTAWNYDLGFSVMNKKIGLFTVYGFYKEMSDLIFTMNQYYPWKKGEIVGGPADLNSRLLGAEYYDERYLLQNGYTNLPFNNTEKATVSGLELSWQTNFWYLPGALKALVLDVNYTILESKTRYPYFQSVIVGYDESGFFPEPIYAQKYETRSGSMQDQPESILNVILGWDYKGFSSRISYRYQSKTVESLDARYSVFDSYYDTFSLVDIMLNQKITKYISCFANVTNIGNHIDDYYYGSQEGRPALPTSGQFYGIRAQLGVRINL
jgi:TonB-dependent receptor